jgi:hypothetical protein
LPSLRVLCVHAVAVAVAVVVTTPAAEHAETAMSRMNRTTEE